MPAAHAARVVLEPIAVTDRQVPGLAEGVTWQQAVSGAHLFKSTMSHEGAAAFALELAGPGVVAFQNDHGLFYRHPDGRIELVARRGDQAPGQPADSRWFSFLPGGIAADGTLFFQARLDWRDGQAAPTTKEEHCLVRWRPGQAPEIITREGGPAPGMPAAILTPLPEAQFSTALVPRVSRSGLLTFSFAVTQDGTSRYIVFGPDAAGAPGPRVAANQRVPGLLGGEVFGDIATPAILDDAGRLLMRTTLAASPGGTPVPANADTVVVGTDAAGVPVVLAREGDPVPGVAGAVFANFDATESTAIGAEGRRAFIAYFVLETRYQCGVFQTDAAGALELVAGGGPAPGFAQPEAYLRYCRSLASTADGRLAFEADVEVGDDTYETLYAQDEDGSLVVVARWGDPAPGTDGIWYDLNTSFHLNGRGQIAFVSTWWSLSENASVAALWLYTPGAGSQRLLQGGDRLSLGPGDERTLKYIRQPWVHPAASGEADGRLLGITNDGEVFVDLYFLEPSINPQQYSNMAVVRLWVEEGADLPPQAEADSWPAGQETLLAIVAPGVLGNDGDPEGAALQARLGEAPAHGALTLAADGGFDYLPDDGFAGLDSFTYEACDPGGNCSPAEVTLEVMPGDACTVFTCDGTNGCAAAARPCGDDDPCTVDSCDPATGCRNAPVPDCCRFDSDCVDEDRCTNKVCQDGRCLRTPVTCPDPDPCTEDSCDPAVGCVHTQIAGCCRFDLQCDDQDLCTIDLCGEDRRCTHARREGCCVVDRDCQPGALCLAGNCVQLLCAGCRVDPECRDPRARCREMASGSYCVVPCDNGCPDGFTCVAEGDTAYCLPENGDCLCEGPASSQRCEGEDWVSVDSCGQVTSVVESCVRGCSPVGCCPLGTRLVGEDCAPDPVEDAGPPLDGGGAEDVGTVGDAGPGEDAAGLPDAGPAVDVAIREDGGAADLGPAGPDATVRDDAGPETTDGGRPAGDVGPARDGAIAGDAADAALVVAPDADLRNEGAPDEGCGCRTPAAPGVTSGHLGGGLLLLGLLLRRRF